MRQILWLHNIPTNLVVATIITTSPRLVMPEACQGGWRKHQAAQVSLLACQIGSALVLLLFSAYLKRLLPHTICGTRIQMPDSITDFDRKWSLIPGWRPSRKWISKQFGKKNTIFGSIRLGIDFAARKRYARFSETFHKRWAEHRNWLGFCVGGRNWLLSVGGIQVDPTSVQGSELICFRCGGWKWDGLGVWIEMTLAFV